MVVRNTFWNKSYVTPCQSKKKIQIHNCPRQAQSNDIHLQNFHCLHFSLVKCIFYLIKVIFISISSIVFSFSTLSFISHLVKFYQPLQIKHLLANLQVLFLVVQGPLLMHCLYVQLLFLVFQ